MCHGIVLEGDYLINNAVCCSGESVASPLHQWPALRAIGCVGSDCRSVIGWNRLHVKFDWSMVGKAKHHCVVIFFSAVQTVHMFQVNKPGVDISAAVLKAEKLRQFVSPLSKQLMVIKSFEKKPV